MQSSLFVFSTPDCKCDMNKKGPWVKGPFCSAWEKARKKPIKGERGREVAANKKYCYLPPESVTGKHCPGATKSEIAPNVYYTMNEGVCKSKGTFNKACIHRFWDPPTLRLVL